MNRVIIAEDEFLIRVGLESSIPWNDLNMEIVASVSDGEQAWQSYLKYKPEVLITDIRMPVLDGIELIKRIRKIDSRCRIVVITCIEYFDIMYSSLDLDITGYLLKSSMTRDSLFRMLSRLHAELSSGSRSNNADAVDLQSITDQLRQYLVERTVTAQQFLKRSYVAYDADSRYCLCLLQCGHINPMVQTSLISILKERFAPICDYQIVPSEDILYLLLTDAGVISFEKITEIFENIQAYVRDIFNTEFRAIVVPEQKFHYLPTSAEISESIVHNPYFFPSKYILLQSDVPCSSAMKYLEAFRTDPACYAFFQGSEKEKYESCAANMKAAFGKSRTEFLKAVEAFRHCVLRVLPAVSMDDLAHMDLDSYENADLLMQALWDACPHYAYHTSYSSGILKSIAFIHTNYASDLCLSDLAAPMNIASHYYAILFRKTTGFGFSDFLLNIRLYHAAEQLQSGVMPISAISDACGFSDTAYFSHCFKRIFHTTPREYRKNGM